MSVEIKKGFGQQKDSIIIKNNNEIIIFNGTIPELIKLIEDAKSIAVAIRADLDVYEGINDNDVFDYKQYKSFSKKY